MILSRRHMLISGLTIAAAGAVPRFAYAAAATPRRLVFVIQRGAADGLAIVAPTGDPAYAAARGALAEEAGGASLNGLLILMFCWMAWRSARARHMAAHRRHALRAYLMVNGVWFLRIGIVPAGAVMNALGHRVTYDGTIFLAVSYLSWIAPLACVALYLAAERSGRVGFQRGVALFFHLLALLTALGIAGAVMFMWWPVL